MPIQLPGDGSGGPIDTGGGGTGAPMPYTGGPAQGTPLGGPDPLKQVDKYAPSTGPAGFDFWWQLIHGFVGPGLGGQPSPGTVNPAATASPTTSPTHALPIGRSIPFIYGMARIAGTVIGFNSPVADTTIVYVLISKGEIEEVTEFFIDGQAHVINDTGSDGIVNNIYLGPSDQSPNIYEPFNITGQPTHAYCRLIFPIDGAVDPPLERKDFQSREYAFTVKGFKVYDHRVDDTIYSENPAVCIRDFLLRSKLAKTTDQIDQDSFDAAADACDVVVSGSPKYSIGLAMIQRQSARTWLDVMRSCCAGEVWRQSGKWKMRVGVSQADDAYVFREGVNCKNVKLNQMKRDRPTQVKITFNDRNSDFDWAPDIAVAELPGVSAGTTPLFPSELTIASINEKAVATRMAFYYLNLAQFKYMGGFRTWTHGRLLSPGMRIRLTQDTGGIDNSFLVTGINPLPSGEFDVAIRQYDDGIYTESDVFVGTTAPNLSTAP